MAESASVTAQPTDPVGRALHSIAKALAIFGGLLSCAMATVVTISVGGRYLLSAPINGDYDIIGILCGCAIFSFLPYCQLKRGNVLADFFTQSAPPQFKSALDAAGNALYLATAMMFTWRLYHGALEMRQSAEQIAAFAFYRWWTIPFDIFCMIVLIVSILYTFSQDLTAARTGRTSNAGGN
jgi:TRAP-type C4-dicarboxylate transport system permease small subunit